MDKRLVLGIATLFSFAAFAQEVQEPVPKKCEQCRQQQQRDREAEEEVATVLTNFAGMVASFISMTQDPHNPRNIGSNLGNIVHGIGNIITAAVRGGIEIEEYVTSEDFRKKVCEMVINQSE